MEINHRIPSQIHHFGLALTIAGSDSGGCAGIQADLKTFAALQVHGMSAITSVTAQNTKGVQRVLDLPEEQIASQVEAVVEDIGVDAVKTGMLSTPGIIRVVGSKIREYEIDQLVVDPVMIATSGDRLIQEHAVETLVKELLPLAFIVTPNISEAEILVGDSLQTIEELKLAAKKIYRMGPKSVIIKGGHLKDPEQCPDILFDGKDFHLLPGERVPTKNTHGSGCTFSAAVTAYLARGRSIVEAASGAKEYVQEAIWNSLSLGHGNGPLGHFFACWQAQE
jgi:hydroxymethylpyrimidine/phosphomethylpyrimidine kinase